MENHNHKRIEELNRLIKAEKEKGCTSCNNLGVWHCAHPEECGNWDKLTELEKEVKQIFDGEKFKPSMKHLAIFKRINEKGFYKPAYTDQEPATKTLLDKGIVVWIQDYRGVIFTPYGKNLVEYKQW